MTLQTKYEFGQVFDFGTERGFVVEVSFKPNCEPYYTIQWQNPFTQFKQLMSESDIEKAVNVGWMLKDTLGRRYQVRDTEGKMPVKYFADIYNLCGFFRVEEKEILYAIKHHAPIGGGWLITDTLEVDDAKKENEGT